MGDIIIFAPKKFEDTRGWFSETFNARREAANGIDVEFIQDNVSFSPQQHTLRGIHFQSPPNAQSKLVRCVRGQLLDVVVDLRIGSPTYAQYITILLDAESGTQIFIPKGFGHGFLTLKPNTEIAYKVDQYYSAESEDGLRWDCPDLAIEWPVAQPSVISQKDRGLSLLRDFESPFRYDGLPMRPRYVLT